MRCTDCDFRVDDWIEMRIHYKFHHTEVKRPDKLFTKEARKITNTTAF